MQKKVSYRFLAGEWTPTNVSVKRREVEDEEAIV